MRVCGEHGTNSNMCESAGCFPGYNYNSERPTQEIHHAERDEWKSENQSMTEMERAQYDPEIYN